MGIIAKSLKNKPKKAVKEGKARSRKPLTQDQVSKLYTKMDRALGLEKDIQTSTAGVALTKKAILDKYSETVLMLKSELEIMLARIDELQKALQSDKEIVLSEDIKCLQPYDPEEPELKKQANTHELSSTSRNIVKGFIGGFVGIIGHFAFVRGSVQELTIANAGVLFFLSFLLGAVLLYYSETRKAGQHKLNLRKIVLIYMVSILITFGALAVYGLGQGALFTDIFKQAATVSLLAILGACTADLLGR